MSVKSIGEPFTMIPNWVIRDGVLELTELGVYIVLLSYRDPKTGLAWPGLDSISKQAKVSRRTVIRTIPKLEAMGLVQVSRQRKATGENAVNVYTVGVFSRERPAGGTGHPAPGSDSESPPSDTVSLPPSDRVSPKKEPPFLDRSSDEDITPTLERELSISFDTSSSTATEKQQQYLSDLHIHAYDEPPAALRKKQWANMSQAEAVELIRSYLSEMPRYDDYQGPQAGGRNFAALSPTGQQWADRGFLPDTLRVG